MTPAPASTPTIVGDRMADRGRGLDRRRGRLNRKAFGRLHLTHPYQPCLVNIGWDHKVNAGFDLCSITAAKVYAYASARLRDANDDGSGFRLIRRDHLPIQSQRPGGRTGLRSPASRRNAIGYRSALRFRATLDDERSAKPR
jgi:hypothetical protein